MRVLESVRKEKDDAIGGQQYEYAAELRDREVRLEEQLEGQKTEWEGKQPPERPVVNDDCRELNFTNEGGIGGTTRLLKNIAGLWLAQECRRIWRQGGRDFGWDELVQLAAAAPHGRSLVMPDDPRFVAPDDMPRAIADFCRETGQPVPDGPGPIIRCVLESLALRYRMVLDWLESLVGGPLPTIHIVGGGAQNRLLCQMTADACGRRVMAGPVEGTAIGNVLVQAIAARSIGSMAEARQVIRHSFPVETYEPQDSAVWQASIARFTRLASPA
jgi:rhamnulokinase